MGGDDHWDEDGMREGVRSSARGAGAAGLGFGRPVESVARERGRDAPAEEFLLCYRFSTGRQIDAHLPRAPGGCCRRHRAFRAGQALLPSIVCVCPACLRDHIATTAHPRSLRHRSPARPLAHAASRSLAASAGLSSSRPAFSARVLARSPPSCRCPSAFLPLPALLARLPVPWSAPARRQPRPSCFALFKLVI